ncbi:hypothetical protein L484_003141 [Morus notabilis]|uniref:Uncharacterized protein n=2 Tax=Morus notabilis TaxID=981085 RepID=W9SDY9_9ROSA|nr:hypothetical protein L484_003141 [Morus notabilis]
MGIAVVSVQAPHHFQSLQFCHSKSRQFHGSTTLKIHQTKSYLNLRCSASVVEEGPPPPIESDSAINEDSGKLPFSGCKACGREEVEKGCNGEGRIQGGIATIPGFGWWPIKAYRPCPGFVASGGRYRRRGQSMDEVAFGRGPVETSSEDQSR